MGDKVSMGQTMFKGSDHEEYLDETETQHNKEKYFEQSHQNDQITSTDSKLELKEMRNANNPAVKGNCPQSVPQDPSSGSDNPLVSSCNNPMMGQIVAVAYENKNSEQVTKQSQEGSSMLPQKKDQKNKVASNQVGAAGSPLTNRGSHQVGQDPNKTSVITKQEICDRLKKANEAQGGHDIVSVTPTLNSDHHSLQSQHGVQEPIANQQLKLENQAVFQKDQVSTSGEHVAIQSLQKASKHLPPQNNSLNNKMSSGQKNQDGDREESNEPDHTAEASPLYDQKSNQEGQDASQEGQDASQEGQDTSQEGQDASQGGMTPASNEEKTSPDLNQTQKYLPPQNNSQNNKTPSGQENQDGDREESNEPDHTVEVSPPYDQKSNQEEQDTSQEGQDASQEGQDASQEGQDASQEGQDASQGGMTPASNEEKTSPDSNQTQKYLPPQNNSQNNKTPSGQENQDGDREESNEPDHTVEASPPYDQKSNQEEHDASQEGQDASQEGQDASQEGQDASQVGQDASQEGQDASQEGQDASQGGKTPASNEQNTSPDSNQTRGDQHIESEKHALNSDRMLPESQNNGQMLNQQFETDHQDLAHAKNADLAKSDLTPQKTRQEPSGNMEQHKVVNQSTSVDNQHLVSMNSEGKQFWSEQGPPQDGSTSQQCKNDLQGKSQGLSPSDGKLNEETLPNDEQPQSSQKDNNSDENSATMLQNQIDQLMKEKDKVIQQMEHLTQEDTNVCQPFKEQLLQIESKIVSLQQKQKSEEICNLQEKVAQLREQLRKKDGENLELALALKEKEAQWSKEKAKKDQQLQQELAVKDQQLQIKSQELAEKDKQLQNKNEELARKDQQIVEQDKQLVEKDENLSMKDNMIAEKVKEISKMDQQLSQKDQDIVQKDAQLREKDKQIIKKDQQLSQKDKEKSQKDQEIVQKDVRLREKDKEIVKKDQQLSQKDKEKAQKDQEIAQKDVELREKTKIISDKDNQIKNKDQQLAKKDDEYFKLSQLLEQKDHNLENFKEEKTMQLDEKELIIKILSQKTDQWIAEKSQKEMQILKLQQRSAQLQSQLDEEKSQKERQILKFQQQVAQLQSQLGEKSQKDIQILKHQQQVAQLNSQLDEELVQKKEKMKYFDQQKQKNEKLFKECQQLKMEKRQQGKEIEEKNKILMLRDQPSHDTSKVKPLRNMGNTCYFNSVLQALNQTPAIIHIESECMRGGSRMYKLVTGNGNKMEVLLYGRIGTLHEKMQAFFQEVNSEQSSVEPSQLLKHIAIKNSRFGNHTQEDSHELLRVLLHELKMEEVENIRKDVSSTLAATSFTTTMDGETKQLLKGYHRAASRVGTTPIEHVVGGAMINSVACRECNVPTQTVEPFFDISLNVPENEKEENRQKMSPYAVGASNSNSKNKNANKASAYTKRPVPQTGYREIDDNDMRELLQRNGFHYHPKPVVKTDVEISLTYPIKSDNLNEANKFICGACTKKKGGGDDDIALCWVAKQLVIHKLPQVLILHMKRFTIGPYSVTKNSTYMSFPLVLDVAPYCSESCLKEFCDINNNIFYGLYAVVVHLGCSLKSGHYIAYVRRRPERKPGHPAGKGVYDQRVAHDGKWYCTSDTTISECNGGFDDVKNCEAYLLFYELLPKI
ncbi:trichohyalin-like isoform X2 [Dysidea avara]|uniref:trichohyalin-like isoform X2 n=1 Tax=Dysidea avara TaxID=196820 RepID=UPI0033195348